MRVFLRFASALLACAFVAGVSAAPQSSSSFVGLGAATGTPSGDIRAAILPKVDSASMPPAVAEAVVTADALKNTPLLEDRLQMRRPVRLAIDVNLGRTLYAGWVRYTIEAMKKSLGGEKRLQVYWVDNRQMMLAVENNLVDVFFSDAAFYALAQSKMNVEQIASFLPVDAVHAEDAQAGVIFERRGAAPASSAAGPTVGTLENLRSATVAALDEKSLAGWLAPAAELQRHGLPFTQTIQKTTFFGDPEAVVRSVLSGESRIGFLPACFLERMQMAGKLDIHRDLAVLNPRASDSLRCKHSTQTYPGWVFGALPAADAALKKSLGSVLFSMEAERYGGQWQLPALNRSIYDLFYELKMGPYEHLATWSFERFMRENAESIALLMFLIFLVLSYSASLSVLVRRKTRQLREALATRDLMEAEAAQSRQHIANLERTGIVGQMSTIIAHELKQPLSAITNYANGLHRRTMNGKFDRESFEFALTEIVNEAERASEIVNRVRAYAKHDYPPRTATDLSVVIGNSITTFRRSRQTNAEIVVRVNPGSMAEVDAWEIELAVLNLLKNAADAISGVPVPRIEVSLVARDEKTWMLSVADNGPYVSDEQLALFFKPLQTTKGSKGMGLGLSIVANIAERHAGRVTVERNEPTGVRFTMLFPRLPRENESIEDVMLPPKLRVYSSTGSSAPTPEAMIHAAEHGSAPEADRDAASSDTPVTIHNRGLAGVLDRINRN